MSPHRPARPVRAAFVVGAALTATVLTVAGCSDSDDDPTPGPTTTAGLGSIDGPASVDSNVVASQP